MITKNLENIISEQSITRPPIVVVLGHVDHGKSSLLEAIREDVRITAKESGGITQHIGAYEVEHQGKRITFIDTPGHEFFSAMRSRGANVADIAILVVAADESCKPQTIEAIEQIKKAGIPMVVALNKIDKPEANPQRVKQELAQHEVMVESFGGQVPSVETSATTKQGIPELLDMLLLVAELENLTANPQAPGEGLVVEALLDAKRGPTVTLLVTNGSVQAGDILATPSAHGKVRVLEDFRGQAIQAAGPAKPAVVLGFLKTPSVGEQFRVFPTEPFAQEFAQISQTKPPASRQPADSTKKTLLIVLKTDVAGSLEALQGVLAQITQDDAVLRIVEAGVGEVGENDIKLASSTGASVVSFRAKVTKAAKNLAERERVPIESFQIIYELIQKVRELMQGSLQEEGGRKDIGSLHVLAVFLVDKKRQVIGGKVMEGEIRKGLRAEIIRAGEIVGIGLLTNIQLNKKDVPVASKGQECGLSFQAEERVQQDDTLQFFI